jgi:hypothetical protein
MRKPNFNIMEGHMGYTNKHDVPKALHLMDHGVGEGHACLVPHLWPPHLPYHFIDLLLDPAWRKEHPQNHQSL